MADGSSGEFICTDGWISVDQQPYVKAVVLGSKLITRDPMIDEPSVLDPDGNREYAIVMREERYVEMTYCQSPQHRGSRLIPSTQFAAGDCICEGCRHKQGETRRQIEARAPKQMKFWHRLRQEGT